MSETQLFNLHDYLAQRHEIAVIWAVEDVLEVRPDLDADQAWQVLQATKRDHDATIGISWEVLSRHAQILFGDAPDGGDHGE